jgi:hypothetical protein
VHGRAERLGRGGDRDADGVIDGDGEGEGAGEVLGVLPTRSGLFVRDESSSPPRPTATIVAAAAPSRA